MSAHVRLTTFGSTAIAAAALGLATVAAAGTAAPSATATTGSSFVGQWHVHGTTLDIAEKTATMVVNLGPCSSGANRFCHETDALAASPSGDGTQLTLVVTAVSYAADTGAPVPNPTAGSSTAVGDSIQLVLQAPGLLKQTVLHGFPGMAGGNPYWCGPGVSQSNDQLCGA